jgi:tetratricopeptide (TPR) repeat protein
LPLSNGQLPQEYAQADSNSSSQSGAVFYNQAADAFSAGRYRDAVRLANHAAVESPQNPKAPELMSLALFALGDYRGAAAQAHAALALGPPADWATVYGYYGNLETYTKQLRDLEKYSNDKPNAPEAHFLRAYQCLLLGYPKQAVKEFEEVVKLAPQDKLAAELLKKYSDNPTPESVPTPPAPMPIEQ